MMGKKKLVEIKAEVAALLAKLPGRSPQDWLEREIEAAKSDSNRDMETLQSLCAALENAAGKHRKTKTARKPAKR